MSTRFVRFATAAALAAGGLSTSAQAGSPPLRHAVRTTSTPAAGGRSQMIDIALDGDRTLRGRFVDSADVPIDGALVTLRQSDRVIARSTTLSDGTFQIERVPTGSYRLSCGSAAGAIRCWTSEAAPPNAVTDGVTFQDNVVRGQAMAVAPALFGTTALTTAAASGSVIGGVAVYAAAEGGSQAATTPAVPTPETPLPPTSSSSEYSGQIVGRDQHGNLVRFSGAVPWDPKTGAPPHGGNAVIILPPDWPKTGITEDPWPASP